nr:PREDICTED: CGG triplet repeat-binding protein 1-like [Latimeria chalumnae]|eukprot:XP_006007965.1 PREDICTED: CGG triplet repeat-binding protein 1-like [Latimeria chalumnae]
MDKFLTKNKVKDHSKRAVNISAKDRAKSMPQVLHEDDGILFCSICNISIDHTCKSTIDNHLRSNSHLKRKHKTDSEQSNAKVLKQTTVSSGFDKAAKKSLAGASVAKQSHVEVITDWIKACTAADIPLEKSDSPALQSPDKWHEVQDNLLQEASQVERTPKIDD